MKKKNYRHYYNNEISMTSPQMDVLTKEELLNVFHSHNIYKPEMEKMSSEELMEVIWKEKNFSMTFLKSMFSKERWEELMGTCDGICVINHSLVKENFTDDEWNSISEGKLSRFGDWTFYNIYPIDTHILKKIKGGWERLFDICDPLYDSWEEFMDSMGY